MEKTHGIGHQSDELAALLENCGITALDQAAAAGEIP
jgi:hypothetical protein